MCLLYTLSITAPSSELATGVRRDYIAVIPHMANFEGLPYRHTMKAIHALLIGSRWTRRSFEWVEYKPSTQEHVLFASILVRVAHTRRLSDGAVPGWILPSQLIHSPGVPHPRSQSPLVVCLSSRLI